MVLCLKSIENTNIELVSTFLENETENPFSRRLKEAPTEDFYGEFDKNVLASSISSTRKSCDDHDISTYFIKT